MSGAVREVSGKGAVGRGCGGAEELGKGMERRCTEQLEGVEQDARLRSGAVGRRAMSSGTYAQALGGAIGHGGATWRRHGGDMAGLLDDMKERVRNLERRLKQQHEENIKLTEYMVEAERKHKEEAKEAAVAAVVAAVRAERAERAAEMREAMEATIAELAPALIQGLEEAGVVGQAVAASSASILGEKEEPGGGGEAQAHRENIVDNEGAKTVAASSAITLGKKEGAGWGGEAQAHGDGRGMNDCCMYDCCGSCCGGGMYAGRAMNDCCDGGCCGSCFGCCCAGKNGCC